MENSSPQRLQVERIIYDQEQLHKDVIYAKPKSNSCKNLAGKFTCHPRKCLEKTIPALDWMVHYKWKTDIVSDFIAGLTTAVMHIPQGMAYALLGNVDPVVGIYMAVFPVIIYFLFGTSRHNSMGTFAVVCLMTGKVVSQYSTNPVSLNFAKNNISDVTESAMVTYTPIQVGTAISLMVGIFQLLMFIFRLGIVSTLFSETLVNGFVTGSVVHAMTSQIKDLFGLTLPQRNGIFTVVYTYIDAFKEISTLNIAATIGSLITITVLIFNNEVLKKWIGKKCVIPVPIELIVVVIGTLVSRYCDLPDLYGITTVGKIPTGLPMPTIPPMSLLGTIAIDSATIAMVSYTISLSMALIFAQELNYEVNANQELLAQGLSNLVGSFFSCIPFSASLSRSTIQKNVGGKTQLASFIASLLLIIVLLWIGPFFEALPKCVLASIIVTALKGMLMQGTKIIRFWQLSKLDASVWILTFSTCVILDIDIGLLIGIIVSLAIIFIQGMKPYTCLLGVVPKTDLYLDINRYKGAIELPGIKIFHYCGGLNFASRMYFKSELYRLVGINPQHELERRNKFEKYDTEKAKLNKVVVKNAKNNIPLMITCIVIDFSALSYIDPSGVSTIQIIAEEFKKIDIPVYIAGCLGPVYEKFVKCADVNTTQNHFFRFFPTVHDAVESAHTVLTVSCEMQLPNMEVIRL